MYFDFKIMCFLYKYFLLNFFDVEGLCVLFEIWFLVIIYGFFMYIKVLEECIFDQRMMCLFFGDYYDYFLQVGDYGLGILLIGVII